MRGAPQPGFARLIFLIRSQTSRAVQGRPLTGTAFPTPVEAESFTAPGDDCVRLYYADSGTTTLLEAGQPHPEDAISILQSRASTTLGTFENQKLMPECLNLGLKSNTRAQKTAQEGTQKAEDDPHGMEPAYKQLDSKVNIFNQNEISDRHRSLKAC